MIRLPEYLTRRSEVRAVLNCLSDGGFQAFLVGGVVRNALLEEPISDIDVATDAVPQRVIELAEAKGFKAVPTGIEHGTVTLVHEGVPVEVTTFRRDIETDGRRAVVHFSDSVLEDAARRDFTMNALYADVHGSVVDPLGGLPDLEARRVRFIGNPNDRIAEDYLRILRFFRFSAWYADPKQGLDQDSLAACVAGVQGMALLSGERVWAELKKLLAAPDPGLALGSMDQTHILGHLLPGTTAQHVAPLIHAESEFGLIPDPIRRLVALGGDVPEAQLPLSRAEARRTGMLREAVASLAGPLRLGFELGAETAKDVLALRFALLESRFSSTDLDEIEKGAKAEFPVKAADLPVDLQGAAIGEALKRLCEIWINEGCALEKGQLLKRL